MTRPLMVGSVAYTPNVVTIWEGIRDYFVGSAAEIDFVLFSNCGRQVQALIEGTIDLAWNTNLAWVRTVAQTDGACRALAMRDTDAVFQTVFVSRTGSALGGLEALRGRRLALGSRDSAQAAILPLHFLRQAGLVDDDVDLLRIDSDVGKHGDTGRSELDALRAVLEDRADAAAIGINTWDAIGRQELMPGAFEAFWFSPTYSHCNFTALPKLGEERTTPWVDHLLAMDWDNPDHRPILEMEGLRRWVPPGWRATRRSSRRSTSRTSAPTGERRRGLPDSPGPRGGARPGRPRDDGHPAAARPWQARSGGPAGRLVRPERALEHRQAVEARFRAAATAWHETGLVMTTPLGTAIDPRNFHRAFKARVQAAGVPVVALHSTRKACASLLVALDVHPRVAMAILRHSQIAVTMDIYSQVASASTSEALRRLSAELDQRGDA